MSKQYYWVNTEPNASYLGVDSIIHCFWDPKLKELAGGTFTEFVLEFFEGVFNAGTKKKNG